MIVSLVKMSCRVSSLKVWRGYFFYFYMRSGFRVFFEVWLLKKSFLRVLRGSLSGRR